MYNRRHDIIHAHIYMGMYNIMWCYYFTRVVAEPRATSEIKLAAVLSGAVCPVCASDSSIFECMRLLRRSIVEYLPTAFRATALSRTLYVNDCGKNGRLVRWAAYQLGISLNSSYLGNHGSEISSPKSYIPYQKGGSPTRWWHYEPGQSKYVVASGTVRHRGTDSKNCGIIILLILITRKSKTTRETRIKECSLCQTT